MHACWQMLGTDLVVRKCHSKRGPEQRKSGKAKIGSFARHLLHDLYNEALTDQSCSFHHGLIALEQQLCPAIWVSPATQAGVLGQWWGLLQMFQRPSRYQGLLQWLGAFWPVRLQPLAECLKLPN